MNHVEHEIKVKYVDNLLAKSQEWQWFIDKLQEDFEISDIKSWEEFYSNRLPACDVLNYYIKILNICDKDWIFTKKEFREIWLIARYYVGNIPIQNCISQITHSFCCVLLWCVWITRLQNLENDGSSILDMRILCQKNFFELAKLDIIAADKDALVDYIRNTDIDGIDIPVKLLCDNIDKIKYSYTSNFFDTYKENLWNVNAFSFQSIKQKESITWQEQYLLDMLNISIKYKELVPFWVSGENCSPNINVWTTDSLYNMKKFFNHQYADFIIETVLYIKYDIEPSHETKLAHIELVLSALNDNSNIEELFETSSYKVISYLFKDKYINDCSSDESLRQLMIAVQSLKKPKLIIQLKEHTMPISKEQQQIVTSYLDTKFMEINLLNDTQDFLRYINNSFIKKTINTEYLIMLQEKFDSIIKTDNRSIVVSGVFYKYMLFLIEIHNTNQHVDKRLVNNEMIRIQKLWQEKYYNKHVDDLAVISKEIQIPGKKIERFNDMSLLIPITLAQQCIPCTEKSILNIMVDASEHVLLHFATNITLTPVFPFESGKINYSRHDVDILLLDYVDSIKQAKGYKLLNVLESDIYVDSIHKSYERNTMFALSIFSEEKKLYELVKENSEINMLQYSQDVSLGMVVQLFPLLEIKIRELSTLLGIFPYKMKPEEFLQANDPSTLLREVITNVYNEQGSFENIPDLLYVYNIMYNSNSCNIRNECVHGRDYLSGNRLVFAFRATLFAIHMIMFRIKTIKENVSDLIEEDDE